MNDELDPFIGDGDADLEWLAGTVASDEHHQVVDSEDPGWVPIGVEHVVVGDPVLACTAEDDRIHGVNVY